MVKLCGHVLVKDQNGWTISAGYWNEVECVWPRGRPRKPAECLRKDCQASQVDREDAVKN